jgi:hypothetical protein
MALPWLTTFVDNVLVEVHKTEEGIVVMRGGSILPPKERDEVLRKAGLFDFVMGVQEELVQKSVMQALEEPPTEPTVRRGRLRKPELTAHVVADTEI